MVQLFHNVANWDQVCPPLLKDSTGQVTHGIDIGYQTLDQKRNAMLRTYLQQASQPSWNDIINALEKGRYINLAGQIKASLQG